MVLNLLVRIDVISARLSDGTTFVTDTSWTVPDSDEFWGDCELDLVGTASTLSVDEYAEALRSVRDGKDDGIEKHHFSASDTEALLLDFLDAVETERDSVATGVDSLRQIEAIKAIYESAERNEPVSVETVSLD